MLNHHASPVCLLAFQVVLIALATNSEPAHALVINGTGGYVRPDNCVGVTAYGDPSSLQAGGESWTSFASCSGAPGLDTGCGGCSDQVQNVTPALCNGGSALKCDDRCSITLNAQHTGSCCARGQCSGCGCFGSSCPVTVPCYVDMGPCPPYEVDDATVQLLNCTTRNPGGYTQCYFACKPGKTYVKGTTSVYCLATPPYFPGQVHWAPWNDTLVCV